MIETIHIEDNLLRRSWDDGLLDLFSGIGLLLIGIAWQLDLVPLGAIGPALLVPRWNPVRDGFIVPRAGYAEPGPRTRDRMTRGMVMLISAGVVSFVLGIALFVLVRGEAGVPAALSAAHLVPALPAVLIAGGAILAGRAFAVPRFYAYALVLVVAAGATIALELGPAAPMLAGGVFATMGGVVFLARFLRENPVVEEGGA